ncbi:hypothetical protein [Aestuariivivens insulae]|uniref:hypothetical protein n=1 Tax=Aestuariivivens insulae TaxID=1621988 RepID=UPI001F57D44D|nr:hypothetical protein [Aestuariivivens insulae]
MDDFEKSIKENRILFDEHKADKLKLWANINEALEAQKNRSKIITLWKTYTFKAVASLVIAFGIFTSIGIVKTHSNQQKVVFNQELTDIDKHYKVLVANQINLVNKSNKLSAQEKKEFLSFMDELDEEYQMLKLELYKNLDSERVLEAIVINYRKRIELIENLLRQINSSTKTNNDHEYIL